ncbi:AraC family transcriptional regulator [bacterium]|nr:MAG: AraC family transcriptional regulator [bacterium]
MNNHFRVHGRLRTKLEELGVNVSAVLRRAGLPQGLFDATRVLVTTEELFALWQAVGDVSEDPAIGLRIGTETKTEHFHPMALAALSTETLGAALRQISRYKLLCCPEEMRHEIDGNEWALQFRWLLAGGAEPPTLTEYCFASMLSLARHGTGKRITPLRVEFAQPRTHLGALETHFGCPVVFGASHNAIVFHADDARQPLVTRNSELLAMLAPQFDEELKRQHREQSFVERVREAIQMRLTGRRPAIDDVAGALHMSARTLQRRLQDEGSNFQRVLEEARHQLARRYLGNSRLELNETAYLLGYEDANSFVRAFRAWEGIPPVHWREAHVLDKSRTEALAT